MRIIAGKYKSRVLKTLEGETTRPSSDRFKEALFNRIGPFFDGGTFLDIFAGSGAVGLEALSRGVEHTTFIEKDKRAQRVILDNINSLKVSNINILKGDALTLVKSLDTTYDYIFMDPPYEYEYTEVLMEEVVKNLKHDSILMVETRKTRTLNTPRGLECVLDKNYGMAHLYIYQMLD